MAQESLTDSKKQQSGDDGRGALVATRPSILESARPRVVVEPVSEVNLGPKQMRRLAEISPKSTEFLLASASVLVMPRRSLPPAISQRAMARGASKGA